MSAAGTRTVEHFKAERRREPRHDVKLTGDLGVDGILPVAIADLSGAGAMLLLSNPPEEGTIADLWIKGFGDLEVKVIFSGDGICGVTFTHPAEHRDRLLKWLRRQIVNSQTEP